MGSRGYGELALVLALMLTACGRGGGELPPDVSGLERLTGIWNAEVTPTTPLLSHPDTTSRANGSITLIPNNWISQAPGAGWTPSHLGATSLDLRPLGFDPRPIQQVPGVVARFEPPDSVWMLIEPARAGETLRLNGRLAGDSIVGHWHYGFPQGGAAGRFVLRRAR